VSEEEEGQASNGFNADLFGTARWLWKYCQGLGVCKVFYLTTLSSYCLLLGVDE
jgi:hypothetical protein